MPLALLWHQPGLRALNTTGWISLQSTLQMRFMTSLFVMIAHITGIWGSCVHANQTMLNNELITSSGFNKVTPYTDYWADDPLKTWLHSLKEFKSAWMIVWEEENSIFIMGRTWRMKHTETWLQTYSNHDGFLTVSPINLAEQGERR
jgi:hypothetical protein